MRLSPFALSLACSTLGAQGSVWTVDDDAPADFASIQLAVNAAANGDAVLVRDGTYSGFTIDGKGLLILGDTTGTARVEQSSFGSDPVVEVVNLAANQTVVFMGLEVEALPGFFSTGEAIEVVDCLGPVWIEDCNLIGLGLLAAVRVTDSSTAIITRSTLVGANAPDLAFGLGWSDGLYCDDSNAYVYDSDLVGSDGLGGPCGDDIECGPATPSGNGASIWGGSMYISGSVLTGGTGDDGETGCIFQTMGNGSAGGDGVSLSGAVPSTVELVDTGLFFGLGGDGSGVCSDGADGAPSFVAASSTLVSTAGVARSLSSTTPVREGEMTDIVFTGAEDDFVFGVASTSALGLALPGYHGPLLVGVPFNLVTVGVLPPSGEVTLTLTMDPLPGGWDYLVRYLQALHVTPGLEAFLSAPTALVVLDDSF